MNELKTIISTIADRSPDWETLLTRPQDRPQGHIVTMVNPFAVRMAREHPDYLAGLARFDRVYADGILLAKLAARVKGRPIERLSFDGRSMAPVVWDIAARHGLGVCLVGSHPGVAERAGGILGERYGIRIAGTRSGYFDNDAERAGYIESLVREAPDLVICGMGVTRQEKFLLDLRAAGWHGVGITCGGYLHQTDHGGTDYYPVWIDRWNLRAPYRLYREPRRMARRYFVDYLPFFRQALPLWIRGHASGRS